METSESEVETKVCRLWMSRNGCQQERCWFSHPAELRGGVAAPVNQLPVEQYPPTDEASRFVHSMIMVRHLLALCVFVCLFVCVHMHASLSLSLYLSVCLSASAFVYFMSAFSAGFQKGAVVGGPGGCPPEKILKLTVVYPFFLILSHTK